MELWIGPVIFAALLSGLVSAAGWFVNSWQTRRLEQLRRDERVHDFQVALRAEIGSDLVWMSVIDRGAFLAEIQRRYAEDSAYSVLVPHMAANVVFAAIVGEIHILPGDVIAPVVDYSRLRQTVEQFVTDLRGERFRQLAAERQLLMYSDYLDMLGRLEILAERAVSALAISLNTPDADRSIQLSAGAQGGASAVEQDAP